MNSVFSAFKTGKSSSSDNTNNQKKSKSSGNGTSSVSSSVSNKKLSTQDPTSYENLRHIREITMSNFGTSDNNVKSTKTLNSTPVIAVLPSVQSSSSLSDKLSCDDAMDFNECTSYEDSVDSSSSSTGTSNDFLTMPPQSNPYSAALPPSGKPTSICNYEPNSEPNLLECAPSTTKSNTEQNFINKIKARSEQLIGSGSSNSNSRSNKPRLSLSSASGVGFNNSMPSVHGRSVNTNSPTTNGSSTAPTRTRLSTHQRNLSLDFR